LLSLQTWKPRISTQHCMNQFMPSNPHTLSSRTVRNTSCFSSKHYTDFRNLDLNEQQRSTPRLKPLDSTALLTTTTFISAIPTVAIPTAIPNTVNAQQQSSSPYTLMILSLLPRINWQSTLQSTASTRPSTFAV
jgi:hypothetical protein